MTVDSSQSRRFDVALSFPGEHRDYVAEVARHLVATFREERVLYDQYHDVEFARPDLDIHLPGLYRTQSELIVIFLCPEYAAKRWCNLEWRHIRQFIATTDAKRIMFLSFGNPGDLTALGILGGDGYIDIRQLGPEVVANKIIKRLSLNQGKPPPSSHNPHDKKIDVSRIDKYAPEELIGREKETEILNDAWDKVVAGEARRPHVLAFVAMGGEGKTSLVARWLADLAHRDWPGCRVVYAWSFYSQGTREQVAASSDLFLKEALVFFGDEEMANSSKSAFDKSRRLAQLAGEQGALLILDGVEPLQYAPTSPSPGELKDQGLVALLKGLAGYSHGLCVVTTRYAIPDLKNFWKTTAPQIDLRRLSKEAGVHLLKNLGVKGIQREYEKLVEDVKGHALTINLIGTYLRDAHGGDIRKRDLIKLEDANSEELGGHAFHVMDAYVQTFEGGGKNEEENLKGRRALAFLRLLGLFDRPATAECLEALWKAPTIPILTEPLAGLSEAQRNLALKRLEDAKLLTVNRDGGNSLVSMDAHPLIREYFARHLREQHPEAWREGHGRLYEHLCATTPDKPDTLEGLQPLYQAIAHGCLAGRQQESCYKVYIDRIQRGSKNGGFYSAKVLGAFGSDLGAVACFFEMPWSCVSSALSESTQSWLLNEAATRLRALGRLIEAPEPMRAGLEMDIQQENWKNAASAAGNLSELELTLGEVAEAVQYAGQSVTCADRCEDSFLAVHSRSVSADVLHQEGQRGEAEALFREAETMQAKLQTDYPLLYSLQGSRYCDLLLAEAERDSWRIMLLASNSKPSLGLLESCRAVELRASQALLISERNNWRLDIALDRLTLGYVSLYTAILESSSCKLPLNQNTYERWNAAANKLDTAVESLRRASAAHHLPRGLLTRAWLRALTGPLVGPESAQSDLDEAWEIAERGPMRLFMTDIHLYRARLFGMPRPGVTLPPYPWVLPPQDLTEARSLIETCGYWRRKEELEDAEKAIL